jgi:hypothetical protein
VTDTLSLHDALPIYENDSLPFTVLLPPDFFRAESFIESPGGGNNFFVRCYVDSGGKKILDSAYTLAGLIQRDRGSFMLPPLGAGTYHYTCSMTLGPLQRHFADSFYVGTNRQ